MILDAVALRFQLVDADRLARLVVLGNVLGTAVGIVVLLLAALGLIP